MKAFWSMASDRLTKVGKHDGQPRRWTVTAWAMLPDGTKERITIRPGTKCNLDVIVQVMNRELTAFEQEHGLSCIDAGFTAVAR